MYWTEFGQSATNTFKHLVERQEFVDVTLACEDDFQMQAHKVILAACSSVFRNLLIKNSHAHPLIYLDCIRADQLEAMVTFMYTGETSVSQDGLEEFIRVATKYRVAGLVADHEVEVTEIKQEQSEVQELDVSVTRMIKEEIKVESRMEEKGTHHQSRHH